MSREYTATVTVTLDGDECDVEARCHVLVAPDIGMGRSWGAELDGDPEIRHLTSKLWLDAEEWLSTSDLASVGEALCDVALEDDREVA